MAARRPSPTSKLHMLRSGGLLETAVSSIAEKRIAHCVTPVSLSQWLIEPRRKAGITTDSLSRSRPHVGHVKVRLSIGVVVKPRGTHSGANVLYPRFLRDIPESAFVVHIEVIAA